MSAAPISAVNDFVVKFANVNGSGSASANGMFAKSILRMGVPVAARNIFPSNIQGLPTWYEVRISEAGHLGRRGGVDLMVAMNPQTWDQDVASIEPGGYLFYDSTKPLPPESLRDDINVDRRAADGDLQRRLHRPAPAAAVQEHHLCRRARAPARHRQDGDSSTLVARAVRAARTKLINAQPRGAGAWAATAAAERYEPIGLQVRRADEVGDRIYVEGNNAAALGAVYGGATVCAWYPITPSTSLAEAFTAHCQKLRTDPETGEAQLRHHPGRGRDRLDRHRRRRRLERRARLHLHLRARHLADEGVRRASPTSPRSRR